MRVAAVALFLLLAACNDSTGASSPYVGTYALASIDGTAPPVLLTVSTTPSIQQKILPSSITLRADGRYVWTSVDTLFVDTQPPRFQTSADSGAWDVTGSDLTLTSDLTSITGGTISTTEIDMTLGTHAWVFRR